MYLYLYLWIPVDISIYLYLSRRLQRLPLDRLRRAKPELIICMSRAYQTEISFFKFHGPFFFFSLGDSFFFFSFSIFISSQILQCVGLVCVFTVCVLSVDFSLPFSRRYQRGRAVHTIARYHGLSMGLVWPPLWGFYDPLYQWAMPCLCPV